MTSSKPIRPAFQSIELDPIDARLEARAALKGIPTLVAPKTEPPLQAPIQTAAPAPVATPPKAPREASQGPTPRSRMKSLKTELPDYAWIAIKMRAAEEMVSVRYIILDALRAKGIPINEADMVEDGRRFRD